MSSFSGDETAPFFGFLGAAAALVFSCMGAAYGTAKSGVGVASMGVMRPELVMKSIVPVVMAGVLGIYGLIIAVIISTGINPKAKSYYLFDGYAHLSSGLACGLAGLSAGMAIGIVGDAGVRYASLAGDIQFLDVRNQSEPYLIIDAHRGSLAALAIHRHAPIIASGSAKQIVKVLLAVSLSTRTEYSLLLVLPMPVYLSMQMTLTKQDDLLLATFKPSDLIKEHGNFNLIIKEMVTAFAPDCDIRLHNPALNVKFVSYSVR
ncbi:hypothetical protein ZIOFF_028797 [Zingiber officinale]|uniref:V-type proton ATPase proteolipid subunit n=4 Tax=Magnoliopsida TaxID=3398 RepID=A0A8J5LA40_ZINOF|nr:hypothetical protein ZIOFF_028797 [Zingiber officinale]